MKSSEGFVFVRRGLHLYYRILGEGPETVVIPNANWLADALQPLAEGRRLILFDPRSRGRSSTVSDRRHLGLEQDVRDLEAVRRYFGLDRLALLGTSYHDAVTALYAMENPERVDRMLLVCPITPRQPGEWAQETPTPEVLIYPPGVPRLGLHRFVHVCCLHGEEFSPKRNGLLANASNKMTAGPLIG